MSSLSLFAVVFVVTIFSTLCAPICAFRAVPSIGIKKVASIHNKNKVCTPTLLYNSQEDEMMEGVSKEVVFQQGVQSGIDNLQSLPENAPRQQEGLDPLIASLTRIDEPTPANVPTRQVPLFGEVPADGNLALLVPAAAIGILGFIFSIVVAFTSRDSIVEELSKVEVPKMEYTPTKIEEGKCRGLCSSQDEDLDGLKNFMEGISKRKVQDL